jgi:hypothetical protein
LVFGDALNYQEALEYFELPLRITAYPLATTSSNGLVACRGQKWAAARINEECHHEPENEASRQHEKGPG